jgi:cytochrome P450
VTTTSTGYDPLDPAVQADPYPHYAALRRDDPVQFLASLDAYVVSRHADVRQVLHDNATFSNEAMAELVARAGDFEGEVAQPAPASIIGTDGEQHGRLRKIVNRGFTPRRVALLEHTSSSPVKSTESARSCSAGRHTCQCGSASRQDHGHPQGDLHLALGVTAIVAL